MVAASGCAPPMPPMPPETISFPLRSPPKCLSPAALNVSYVPCTIPCEPMYIHEPAVIWPYIISPARSSSLNFSQLEKWPTKFEFAMSTRGAYS